MVDHNANTQRYGGKAASLLAQYHFGNTDMIFPFSLDETAQREKGIKPKYTFSNSQIVRGSAPGDEKGLVDILRTLHDRNAEDLNEITEKRETHYPSEREYSLIRAGETPFFHDLQIEYQDVLVEGTKKAMDGYIERINRLCEEYAARDSYTKPSCIEKLIEQSRNERTRLYVQWEGLQDYSGIASVVIQPQNKHFEELPHGDGMSIRIYRRGSIVEHPNIKDHYLINIVERSEFRNASSVAPYRNDILQALVDSTGTVIKKEGDFPQELAKPIVEMKIRSRKAGFIPNTHSSQVEFGLLDPNQDFERGKYQFQASPSNKIIFYQERAFLPFDIDSNLKPKNYTFNRFGKAPKEGLELRILKMGELSEQEMGDGIPSAYIWNSEAFENNMSWFHPNNMRAYIVPSGETVGGNSLEHDTYRWVQKARISLLKQRIDERVIFEDFKHGEIITIK